MDVSINQLETGPKEFQFEVDLPQLSDRFGKVTMQAHARLEPSQGEFRLTGTYEAQVHFSCDRCTKETDSKISGSVNLVLVPESEDVEEGEDVEFLPDTQDSETYNGQEIHLLPIYKDQVTLDLPMQMLCDPGCKGLCSHCGGDLNVGGCRCGGINPNSPFAGLKDLLNS